MEVDYNVNEEMAANTLLLIKTMMAGQDSREGHNLTTVASAMFSEQVINRYKHKKSNNEIQTHTDSLISNITNKLGVVPPAGDPTSDNTL